MSAAAASTAEAGDCGCAELSDRTKDEVARDRHAQEPVICLPLDTSFCKLAMLLSESAFNCIQQQNPDRERMKTK